MLLNDLGYRAPDAAELAAANTLYPKPGLRRFLPEKRAFKLPVAHLCVDPLITYSGSVIGALLGFASITKGALRNKPMWVLVSPTWSLAEFSEAESIRATAITHRAAHPHHKIIFLCNAKAEVENMLRLGEAAILHTKTSCVSETIFKPLPETPVVFDAIYNAQIAPWKRHELTAEIDSCAFTYYRASVSRTYAAEEKEILARHKIAAPDHVFLNDLKEDGGPVRFSSSEINHHLNRAAIGLCLSAKEGAMLASVEYMLAGLPIVSTPSTGGRDVFFDEEYCIIADPNPRAIADAVKALKARNISRAYVHERTLTRLNVHRTRFLGLINDILAECNADVRIAKDWPFTHTPTSNWVRARRARRQAKMGRVDDFGQASAFFPVSK